MEEIKMYEEEGRLIIVLRNPSEGTRDVVSKLFSEIALKKVDGVKAPQYEEEPVPSIPDDTEKDTVCKANQNLDESKNDAKESEETQKPSNTSEKKTAIDKVERAIFLANNPKKMKELGLDRTIKNLYPAIKEEVDAQLEKRQMKDLEMFLSVSEKKDKEDFATIMIKKVKTLKKE